MIPVRMLVSSCAFFVLLAIGCREDQPKATPPVGEPISAGTGGAPGAGSAGAGSAGCGGGNANAIDHLIMPKSQAGRRVPGSSKVFRGTGSCRFASSDHAALRSTFP